jgi:signal recognition particle GTPase
LTIEDYLRSLEAFIDDPYARQMRWQMQMTKLDGKSELAMLASPSREEYEQMARAVAIMTPTERKNAERLTDEQVERIAEDAKADKAVVAIFLNGYAIKTLKSK